MQRRTDPCSPSEPCNCYASEHDHCAKRDRPVAPHKRAFIRLWSRNPLNIGAIAPSGKALSRLITSEISSADDKVLELGPGTGVFTQELLAKGIKERNLTLIEYEATFAKLLRFEYPKATVLNSDASRLESFQALGGAEFSAAISGLPLLIFSEEKVISILSNTFRHLGPRGSLYQFTYRRKCPVPKRILEGLGLKAERLGSALLNIPPATVYRLSRSDD